MNSNPNSPGSKPSYTVHADGRVSPEAPQTTGNDKPEYLTGEEAAAAIFSEIGQKLLQAREMLHAAHGSEDMLYAVGALALIEQAGALADAASGATGLYIVQGFADWNYNDDVAGALNKLRAVAEASPVPPLV